MKRRKNNQLSIIILTMNRERLLDACLASLAGLVSKEDEVVVLMDSQSNDNTESVLKKNVYKLPLVYKKTTIRGYPRLYNLAIKVSSNDVLVFINDDCEVDRRFIKSIKKAQANHPGSVVQGMTYSRPKNNIYAEIMGDNYYNWIQVNITNRIGMRMKTIDNKNVSIPRYIFQKHGTYNEKFVKGSEDIEFGNRLYRAGVPILFDPSIIVYHHERSTLRGFVNQHMRIAVSESIVDRIIPPESRVHALNWHKTSLHMKSAIQRELLYAQQFRIKDFLLLPFLYMLLFGIRMYGYYIKSA